MANGNFDFLFGEEQQFDPNFDATQNVSSIQPLPVPGPVEAKAGRFDFLGDPNIQRALAQTGRGFSRGDEIGEILGSTAEDLVRRRQLQKASAKQSGQQAGLAEQVRQAIQGDFSNSDLFGPADDLSTANGATIKDGKITLDIPTKPKPKPNPFDNLQDPPTANQQGSFDATSGQDLPDFE